MNYFNIEIYCNFFFLLQECIATILITAVQIICNVSAKINYTNISKLHIILKSCPQIPTASLLRGKSRPNEYYPRYDTKPSDGEASNIELWGMWSTHHSHYYQVHSDPE